MAKLQVERSMDQKKIQLYESEVKELTLKLSKVERSRLADQVQIAEDKDKMIAMEDKYEKLNKENEELQTETRNIKKSLIMKDDMLDKMQGDVAAKDKLDKQIAELTKSIEAEKASNKTLTEQLKSSKEEMRKQQQKDMREL